MSLVLNEEQHLLKNSAREFLSAQAPISAFRQLRDSDDHGPAYNPSVWQQMVDLGWTAISIDEAYEGLGFGYKGLGLIFEEIGQRLTASPLFSNIVLCASLIETLGTEAQKQEYLPKLAAGEMNMALAFEEGVRHAGNEPLQCSVDNSADANISGEKKCVLQANSADFYVVVARQSNKALGVYIVDAQAEGIKKHPMRLLDGSLAHHVEFNKVSSNALGDEANTETALNIMLARARTILAAEMLGSSLAMFQLTTNYLKEREQFDVKIGSFQALKHRASQMFIQLELAKSCVLAALNAVDDHAENLSELACLAKAHLNDTFILVTDEATQMHGGMGVTDELDVGMFLKRARVYTQLFGDSSFLRDQYARLKNF